MGLRAMIQKFSRGDKPVIVHRYSRGSYRGGVFQSKIQETFQILCNVQPIHTDFGRDVVVTAGNVVRNTNSVKIFSTQEILVDNPATGQKADRLEIDGVMYEARANGKYGHVSLGHYETVCVKVGEK